VNYFQIFCKNNARFPLIRHMLNVCNYCTYWIMIVKGAPSRMERPCSWFRYGPNQTTTLC